MKLLSYFICLKKAFLTNCIVYVCMGVVRLHEEKKVVREIRALADDRSAHSPMLQNKYVWVKERMRGNITSRKKERIHHI